MSKPKTNVAQQPTPSGLVRGLKWIAGPAALLAVLGWMVGFGQAAATSRAPADLSPAADAPAVPYLASTLGPAPQQDLSRAAQGSALRESQRIAAERNQAGEQDKKAFRADGWELVKTDAPDARLVGLDPALLDGREDDLRVQITSTVAAPAQAGKLADIARRAREPQTRTAAVEALGRIGGAEAQRALMGLLSDGGFAADDPGRRAIAPLLRPSELHEPYAAELAAKLDAERLTPVERKQIAFTLALIGLRDGTKLPAATLASLSPTARALLDSMTALATQSNPIVPSSSAP